MPRFVKISHSSQHKGKRNETIKHTITLLTALLLAPLAALCAESSVLNPYGPIRYPGILPRVTKSGVEAPTFHFDPKSVPKPKNWDAQWIWLPTNNPAAAGFRKEITFDAAPSRVTAWVSAHCGYRLYVNGQLVSRGPDDIGTDGATKSHLWTHRWHADARDLTPYFKPGKNVVAAEVFSSGWSWLFFGHHINVKNGFFFQAEALVEGGKTVNIFSDATWKSSALAEFSEGKFTPHNDAGTPLTEESTFRFDAAKEQGGWKEIGFDNARWLAATPIKSDHGPMQVSEIPPRMEAVWPAAGILYEKGGAILAAKSFAEKRPIVLKTDGAFTVQFDRVLSAFYSLRCKGGAGATITIRPSEQDRNGGRRSSCILLKGGSLVYETPSYTSFTMLNVVVTGVKEPVEIEEIQAHFVSQPVEYQGSFACSDDKLTRLWAANRRSVQGCMQTYHLDSPNNQEALGDTGDYLVQSVANWQAFHAPALVRQDLRKIAWIMDGSGYQMFHTSYQLYWLQMLVEYYQHTGDQELVRELSPFVNKLLDQFKSYRGTSGLLSNAPDYMFMDFREIAGINCHHPPAVIGMGYMTALFCRALEDGRRVAQLVGDSQRAEHYARLHREMSAAFEKELWNPEKGLYRDGKPFISSVKPSKWLPEDTQIETFSPHVNIMSILYGLAPSERRAGIFKTLLSTQKELNVSAYFGYFTLPAMDRAGLFAELGLPQMLKWPIRPESKTVSEHGHGGTLSHGWISAPLINLSQRVLGITPAEPGYVKADIRPQLCGLSWAKGAVPLPKGKVIKVEWRQKDRYFELQADSPVPATITLPFSSAEVLRATVNGRPFEIKSNPVQFEAKPGNLTVVVEIKQP